MRLVTLLLPLASASLGTVQDGTQVVTYNSPAGPASRILKELSQRSGLRLETTPQTQDETLLISVKEVPVKDLLAKIAQVADAEWRPIEGGFRLTRDSDQTTKNWRRELSERGARYDGAIRELSSQQANAPAWSDKVALEMARQEREKRDKLNSSNGVTVIRSTGAGTSVGSPEARLLIPVLNALGGATLAAVGVSDRVIFSLTPNRMQKALPSSVRPLLDQFIRQQRQYAEAFSQLQPDDTRQLIINGSMGPALGSGDPSLGLGPCLLMLTRRGDAVSAQMVVSDRNGQTIGTAGLMVTPKAPTPALAPGESTITLPAVAVEFAKHFAPTSVVGVGRPRIAISARASGSGTTLKFGGNSGQPPVAISEELRQRLINPENEDPADLFAGECLRQIAARSGANVVAAIPDAATVPLARTFTSGTRSEAEVIRTLDASGHLQVNLRNGWLTTALHCPVSDRRSTVPRRALGKLIRSLQAKPFARLDEVASFAIQLRVPLTPESYEATAMRLVNINGASNAMTHLTDLTGIKLYASLTQAQNAVLHRGEALTVAQLSPDQRSLLSDGVFNSQDGPRIEAMEGPGSFAGLGFGDVRAERTQLFPNGIPADAQLTLNADRQLAAIARNSSTGASAIVTPDDLASQRFVGEKSELSFLGAAPTYDTYQPAQQTEIHLTLRMGQGVFQRDLQDAFVESAARAVAFSGLPKEFQARTEEALNRMRQQLGSITFGSPGQKKIIPPL